jgi:hypothetical protein
MRNLVTKQQEKRSSKKPNEVIRSALYSHLKIRADIIKNTMVIAISTSRLFITPKRFAPSSIIFLEASIKCVTGKNLDAVCIIFGVPSRENHIPDKNIMGQITILMRPPANSSLFMRVENKRPRDIWHNIAAEVITIRSKYDHSILK